VKQVFKKLNWQNDAKNRAHAGDIVRDAKDWLAAINHYEAYLTQTPRNAPIWVQLGNCTKEAGDYEKSFAAYQQALSLRPIESDTHLAWTSEQTAEMASGRSESLSYSTEHKSSACRCATRDQTTK
jgi:tetratricopeptide (TPR) repeat protein